MSTTRFWWSTTSCPTHGHKVPHGVITSPHKDDGTTAPPQPLSGVGTLLRHLEVPLAFTEKELERIETQRLVNGESTRPEGWEEGDYDQRLFDEDEEREHVDQAEREERDGEKRREGDSEESEGRTSEVEQKYTTKHLLAKTTSRSATARYLTGISPTKKKSRRQVPRQQVPISFGRMWRANRLFIGDQNGKDLSPALNADLRTPFHDALAFYPRVLTADSRLLSSEPIQDLPTTCYSLEVDNVTSTFTPNATGVINHGGVCLAYAVTK